MDRGKEIRRNCLALSIQINKRAQDSNGQTYICVDKKPRTTITRLVNTYILGGEYRGFHWRVP